MAIVIDAASNSGYNSALSSISWSHTVSGSDRLLIVGVSMLSVAGSSVSGITYNGVALTKLRHDVSVSGTIRTEIWYLVGPATGANTVAVTLSVALDSVACALSLTGVDQTTPVDAQNGATGVGTTATVNVTTVNNSALVIDAVATSDTAITVGAGQTQRNNVSGTLGSGAQSTEGPKTPAGSVTMSWDNVGALDSWTISAMSVNPAVSVDRWHPNINQPLEKTNPVKRLQYSYPFSAQPHKLLINQSIVSAPSPMVTFYQHFQYQKQTWYPKIILSQTMVSGPTAHVIFLQNFQYPHRTEAPNIDPERIDLDKWYREMERPPKGPTQWRFLFPSFPVWPVKLLIGPIVLSGPTSELTFFQHFQYQNYVIPITALQPPEIVSMDKWWREWGRTIWGPKHFEFLYPPFTVDAYQLTQLERLTIDKWYRELSRPRWDVRRWQFTYPYVGAIDPSLLIQGERVDLDKWYRELERPPKGPIHREFQYPSLFIDPYQLSLPERVDVDKWFKELSRPRWDVRRWQFIYPAWASLDPKLLTQTERIDLDKWFRELERPPKRLKATPQYYPSFFWQPKIIISTALISGAVARVIFPTLIQYQKLAFGVLPIEPAYALPSKRSPTDWAGTAKDTSDFSGVNKDTTDFSGVTKITTDHTPTNKDTTDFTPTTKDPTDWTDP